jgi:hypothetical protein
VTAEVFTPPASGNTGGTVSPTEYAQEDVAEPVADWEMLMSVLPAGYATTILSVRAGPLFASMAYLIVPVEEPLPPEVI